MWQLTTPDKLPMGRYCALYGDGAGGVLFMKTKGGIYLDKYGHQIDEQLIVEYFKQYCLLPDGYKLAFEKE